MDANGAAVPPLVAWRSARDDSSGGLGHLWRKPSDESRVKRREGNGDRGAVHFVSSNVRAEASRMSSGGDGNRR